MDCFELARKMRGTVEELDDTYIEKLIPEHILNKLRNIPDKCHLVDEDGFWWAPSRVMATKVKLTGEIVVVVADKALGMGCHEMKVVDQHGNIRIEQGNHLI